MRVDVILEVMEVHVAACPHRLEVAQTFGLIGRLPGRCQRRQQDGNQQNDDRNHHQQFDEREALLLTTCLALEYAVHDPGVLRKRMKMQLPNDVNTRSSRQTSPARLPD
jgi:hypothetical protein